MKLLRKSAPLKIVMLIMLLSVSSVFAVIQVARQITMNMTVKSHYNMQVYDIDHTTVLTAISWGDIYKGETYKRPADTPLNNIYYLDNKGDAGYAIKINYTVQNLPTGVTLTMHVCQGTAWQTLNAGELSVFTINAGEFIIWYVEITVGVDAPLGSYSDIVLTWNAQNV